jgi:hypothetical protein
VRRCTDEQALEVKGRRRPTYTLTIVQHLFSHHLLSLLARRCLHLYYPSQFARHSIRRRRRLTMTGLWVRMRGIASVEEMWGVEGKVGERGRERRELGEGGGEGEEGRKRR